MCVCVGVWVCVLCTHIHHTLMSLDILDEHIPCYYSLQ